MRQLECDAILFDLDGVLIDSSACIVRHWRGWAQLHGLDVAVIMRVAHGVRTIETMRQVAPHLNLEAQAARFTAGEIVDTDGVVRLAGAAELLEMIPADAWAIVTSGGRELARARLARAELPIPGTLVTADDVRDGKPAPEPYLLAAKRLGIPAARCVVVEDSPAGIEAGRAAGMPVIAVTTTHARGELLEQDNVIDQLSDLRVSTGESGRRCLVIQTGISPHYGFCAS